LRRTLLALVLILDLFLVYKLIFGAQGMVAYRDMLAKFVAVQREAEGADQRHPSPSPRRSAGSNPIPTSSRRSSAARPTP